MKSQSSKLLNQAVNSINRFQFDFYSQFSEQKNLMISPLGLYLVLAMLHEGSLSETRAALANLLHHHDSELSLTSSLKMLIKELNSRTQLTAVEKEEVKEQEAYKNELISRGEWNEDVAELYGSATAEDIRLDLSIANGMWIQDTYACKNEFLETVRSEMAAEVSYLDFEGDPINSCRTINNWIQEKTRGRSGMMLSPEYLQDRPVPCRMILCNALYFKARWQTEFPAPVAGPFHLLDGTTVQAQMMTNEFWGLDYMQTDSFLAVELPYYNRPMSMIIFSPIQRGPEAFLEMEREFHHHWSSFQLHRQTKSQSVTLTIPEFKIKAKHRLSSRLSAMGGQFIFEQGANFSGISDEQGIYIDEILQNTYIAVDQYGTEATAATLAALLGAIAPNDKVILKIDHPFLFTIVDKPTGVILFVGKVTNPI